MTVNTADALELNFELQVDHWMREIEAAPYNPGTALNIAYRNHFFLTGAPNGNQYAFRVEPDGASFKMVGDHQIGKGAPIVGWKFGPDGGLYGVDWGGGYPLNQKGAIWKIDDPSYANSPERKEVARLGGTLDAGPGEDGGYWVLARFPFEPVWE